MIQAGEVGAKADPKVFRAKLVKIMPGYNWRVHKAGKGATKLTATGTQSSGFNRCSTLEVTWESNPKYDWYTARSAGFGLRAPWLGEGAGTTLARALRSLQDHYQHMAAQYGGQARTLQAARTIDEQPALKGQPHDHPIR